jgi:hypothetical protein
MNNDGAAINLDNIDLIALFEEVAKEEAARPSVPTFDIVDVEHVASAKDLVTFVPITFDDDFENEFDADGRL